MKAWGVIVAFGFISGCATQERAPLTWDGERLSTYSAEVVRLRDKEGKIHGVVRTGRVKKITEATRRIEAVAGTTVQVTIVSGAEPNAMAWHHQGVNRIGFTLGMLDLLNDDYDAYAAIIGHEVAHLVLEHRAVREKREDIRSGASQVLGLALSFAGVPMSGTVASIATTAVSTTFSREEERDADSHGIGYARQAGFDPYGAVRAWEKMSQRSSSNFVIPFLSSHPMAEERLETMRQIAASAPQSQPRTPAPQGLWKPSVRRPSITRLRPVGELKDAPEYLMTGELYVDMGSISAIPDSPSKRGWWVINNTSQGSLKARVIANCDSTSFAVLHTARTAEMNGEGKAIESSNHTVRPTAADSPALRDAVSAMCQ